MLSQLDIYSLFQNLYKLVLIFFRSTQIKTTLLESNTTISCYIVVARRNGAGYNRKKGYIHISIYIYIYIYINEQFELELV